MRRDAGARVAVPEVEDREVVLGRDLVEAPLVVGAVAGVVGVLAGHLVLAAVAPLLGLAVAAWALLQGA
jgi:hypothetical protein